MIDSPGGRGATGLWHQAGAGEAAVGDPDDPR